jgi:hypothetical protein
MTIKLRAVIQCQQNVGIGERDSPRRFVMEWWTPDGTRLARVDEWAIQRAKDLMRENTASDVVTIPTRVLEALVS